MTATRGGEPPLRLLATVTFNPNQLRAHLLPLIALAEVESITLVADVMPPPLDKVEAIVPSAQARRLLGRAGAKLELCHRLARQRRFDWVLGFNFVPHGYTAQLVGRLTGVRSLYHMIGGEREWRGGGYASDNKVLGRLPWPVPPLEWFILRQIKKATLVATMGPRTRDRLIAHGFSADRVVVIPPSTDVSRFRPRESTDESYQVVSVGSLTSTKRFADLIEAIALLRDTHGLLRVAIAGDGPLRGDLQALAARLGVRDRVCFLGHVSAIENVYAGASAFVLPSRWEGLPVSMLDAMASGLTPIVTDVGEIGTTVVHRRNGLLYPVGDVVALARALDGVLSDTQWARALGRRARDDVLASFSIDSVAAIYRDLLAPSAAKSSVCAAS